HDRVIFQNIVEIKKFLELDWVKRLQLPEPFVTFSWNALDEHELSELKAAEGDWYPSNRSPFRKEQLTDPEASIGLRYRGGIIGWSILHRIDGQTSLCDCIFTKEEFQTRGRAIPLAIESLKRAEAQHYKYVMFYVNAQNDHMRRFTKRRLASVLWVDLEIRVMWKDL
ncbi:MAG TPA: GNAT family N-acetyltransferase, partial [Bacillales bacterium]